MSTPGLASMMILSFEPSGTNASASIAAVSGLRTEHLWPEAFSMGKYLRHISMGGKSPAGTSGRTSPGRRLAFPLAFALTSREPAFEGFKDDFDRYRQELFVKAVLRSLCLQSPVLRRKFSCVM